MEASYFTSHAPSFINLTPTASDAYSQVQSNPLTDFSIMNPSGQRQQQNLTSYPGQSSIQTHICPEMSLTSTFPRQFVFVDGLGIDSQGKIASHRKEVRSYLSREGYRKKRNQKMRLYRSHSAPYGRREAATGTNDCVGADPVLLDIQLIVEQAREDDRHESKTAQFPWPHLHGSQTSEASSKLPQHHFTACSLLTAIERDLVHFDPFITLPVTLNHFDEALPYLAINLFLDSTPSWASSKFTEAVSLHLAFLHKPIFCSMLAATSAYIDSVSGHDVSVDTIRWTAASTFYVSQLVSNPESRYGDDALVGILALLSAEILVGNRESCHVLSRSFAQVLRHRGGLRSLQGSHSIDMFVSFVLITPAGKGQIEYLNNVQPDTTDGIVEMEDWVLDLNLLMGTLRNLVQLSSARVGKRAELCDGLKDFMQMLTTARDAFEESQQYFILLYLALARWDCRKNPQSYINLLQKLRQKLVPQTNLAEVAWILVQGLNNDRQRKWQALRIAKVLHRLKNDTAFQVKNFLCGLIWSSFDDDVEVAMITGKDFLKISDEALAGLPIERLRSN